MKTIDINCDVGEGVLNEHLIMPYISSCNIACGGHFGDNESIDKTIALAIKHTVLIGVHPSFPDKKNFGRKVMDISKEALQKSIENQIDLFVSRLSFFNEKLNHIKPHGALYNLIAVNEDFANVFVRAIKKYTDHTFLYVPYNSVIEVVALRNKIKIKYEAFADRAYNDDLTLVSRGLENAIITNTNQIFKHVYLMFKDEKVKTISGFKKQIKADTFCVHSDTENAVEIVDFLYKKFKNEGVHVG